MPRPISSLPAGADQFSEGDVIPTDTLVFTRYYNPKYNNGAVLYYFARTGNEWTYKRDPEDVIDDVIYGFIDEGEAVDFACFNAGIDRAAGFEIEAQGFMCD